MGTFVGDSATAGGRVVDATEGLRRGGGVKVRLGSEGGEEDEWFVCSDEPVRF